VVMMASGSRCRYCGKLTYLRVSDPNGCRCILPTGVSWNEYITLCPLGCVMVVVEEAWKNYENKWGF